MMKIPILDLKRQVVPIRKEIDEAIKRVIDNTSFVFGKEISDFENMVCEYARVKFSVGVSNGTDAISLALISLGIKPGDEVLVPSFTYYASAGAIASIGAIPVLTDIDAKTYNISIESADQVISKRKKVKAIVPVHLFGQCADMDAVMKIAAKYRLSVVEDTAQAFGAEYKSKKAGTIGDCGAVSFFPGKNLGAFGDAGMVLTNNETAANNLRLLRNQGNEEKYNHIIVGFNHRLDSLQAAVLGVKIKYIDSWNKLRQENAAYLNQGLKSMDIKTPYVASFSNHIYHQYVIRVSSKRDELIEHLRSKDIDARVYYPIPLHLQACFKYLGYKSGDFPESEKASRDTLAIPVYPDLTKEELDYIIGSIKEFMR